MIRRGRRAASCPAPAGSITQHHMDERPQPDLEWDVASAELAYGVVALYVEHAQISGLLIAMLASALGEERLKPVAQSEPWQLYLASKRALGEARNDVEALTRLIDRMRAGGAGETVLPAADAEAGQARD